MTSTDGLQFITINERAYKYIRQFTIKNAEDALIELVTNCFDAYKKTSLANKQVEIDIINYNTIKVRDFALGLTSSELETCFLQVGNLTSDTASSRGFFSRGAKDISAIGNITFNAIKNNKYSQIILTSDAYGKVNISDVDTTYDIRKSVGIYEPNNGLEVTISLLPNFYVSDPVACYNSLSKLAVLRDIFSDDTNEIYGCIYDNDTLMTRKRLSYTPPVGTLLLELEYTVPNYDVQAKFVVYKADKPIDQPKKENELEFGFLIKDSTTIYEASTIADRFRFNPYMPQVFGYIYCDEIHRLLVEFDANGANSKNPYPILDPSRLTGLNASHPFVLSLLSVPSVRIDSILRELNTNTSSKVISLNEIGDLMDELSKYGLNLLGDEQIKMNFVPKYDEQLAKAIEDDRMNFVTYEKQYLLTTDYAPSMTDLDKYVKNEILRITPDDTQQYVFIMDNNNQLIQIPNKTQTDDINDPIKTLDLDINMLNPKRPYIYKITPSGQLVKLYIFDKGRLEDLTNPENEYVLIKNKQFNIYFIDDINIQKRYVIENSNGLDIKLNLHDPMIKKYLLGKDVDQYSQVSIQSVANTKSLVFLKELLNDILSDIIVENDVISNNLILDSNNYTNLKKIIDRRNQTVSRIQIPLDNIFDKYIHKVIEEKKTSVGNIVTQISTAVGNKIDLYNEGQDILNLKAIFDEIIGAMLE